jgi:hypothetical protein
MAELIVGSKMPEFPSNAKPDNSGYGENGFSGPSSDMPGDKPTVSGFLPQATIPSRTSDGTADWQTRKLADGNVPIHPGMKSPAAPGKIPAINTHRASGPITNSSFQR